MAEALSVVFEGVEGCCFLGGDNVVTVGEQSQTLCSYLKAKWF